MPMHAPIRSRTLSSIAPITRCKMGELAFIMAHKVNGVSALHTELMKSTVFSELHRLHPGPHHQPDQRRHAAPLAAVVQPARCRG